MKNRVLAEVIRVIGTANNSLSAVVEALAGVAVGQCDYCGKSITVRETIYGRENPNVSICSDCLGFILETK